jgi:O-glycosyl hydrolase
VEILQNHITQLDAPHKAYCSKCMSMDVNVSYIVLTAGLSSYLYIVYFYGPETRMIGHIANCEKMVAKTYPS